MATKTFTFDTGEWSYPSINGITHVVTNAQTATFELTDGGASAVTYQQDHATSVTTTDGLRINMRPQATMSQVNNIGTIRTWGPTADAQDAVAVRTLSGEFACECPVSGDIQYWKAASLTVDDVDTPTAISGTFEDQFGNTFSWTTVTVS